jgi:hypothetical protein
VAAARVDVVSVTNVINVAAAGSNIATKISNATIRVTRYAVNPIKDRAEGNDVTKVTKSVAAKVASRVSRVVQ